MRRILWVSVLMLAAAVPVAAKEEAKASKGASTEAAKPVEWSMNATAIQACSCPVFCPCYFGTKPADHAAHDAHGDEHYCRFNSAYKINKGHYGDVSLDGAKFWLFGDLGAQIDDGELDWGVLTLDLPTTKKQRLAIVEIVNKLYPVGWKHFRTTMGDIDWTADKHTAHAVLDSGKVAEVVLSAKAPKTNTKAEPTAVENLKYWGSTSNTGFVQMTSTLNEVKRGEFPFKFKGTNGYMITFDIDSKSTATSGGGGSGGGGNN